ncbi:poly-gamma-glutamate biosynthesis protein [Actinomadura sp. CNU-125]|uniref:CapA family protein n=1 Tax=Actinomadura sp. CNU-125 TaxID=1904961 RepID=UPI0009666200|nr:CapA family protein [Actinomadura sp. CNU-125]OLT22707.1 poly-gamma-glutamate biosynthesis protein [Actinomadura sp. CNU-125]
MSVTLVLAGDTMLGRGVAERVAADPDGLFSAGVRDAVAEADLAVLNLECCVSDRGRRWDPVGKAFHFRAPPPAAGVLAGLGVDCVTLANNHALDYGPDALADTLDHLAAAGVRTVGAGRNPEEAYAPAVLEAGGVRLAIVGVTDHPADFAAAPGRAGVAHADLETGVPARLLDRIRDLRAACDAVVVTPHWGPNMTSEPLPYVRRAARAFLDAGATLVAGHSAHVFHGVAGPVLFDLGDFIDDYAVDDVLRNDLGLLFRVTLDDRGPVRVDAIPVRLDYARTRLAEGTDRAWITSRLTAACAAFGTGVAPGEGGRLTVTPG